MYTGLDYCYINEYILHTFCEAKAKLMYAKQY